jgi:hypothetical protein
MEFGHFRYKSNSANIAYYTEVDGPHWVSVLEDDLETGKHGWKRKDVSTYHFSVYGPSTSV